MSKPTTRILVFQGFVSLALLFALLVFTAQPAVGQTPTAFTYQGRITDAGNPATGSYDIQFKVFDALTDGTQQGSIVIHPTVQVTGGIFSVELDFGAGVFDGAARYIEICVRPAGSADPYTVLTPRQPITSTPYAMRSAAAGSADTLSAACVNCVTGAQVQSVDGAQITGTVAGSQISGAIPAESVPVGSSNYIQNSAAALGAGRLAVAQEGGFDITGDGAIGGKLFVNGPIGIGIANPFPDYKLDVVGATRISTGGSGGAMLFHTPNSETGITFQKNNRADIRFNDSTLTLVAGTGGVGPPPSTNGITISTGGNVGIGVANPASKLEIFSGASGVSAIFAESASGRGIWGKSVNSRGVYGESVNNAGVYGVSSTGTGVTGDSTSATGFGGFFQNSGGGTALLVFGRAKMNVLELTGGLDLAERFEIVGAAKPGMVVAIDPQNVGKFSIARGAYNRRVAGVISGAGDLAAGMVLTGSSPAKESMPVALSGRVWVYCDATKNRIKPGDLLTTSATPGHAMKVISHTRAQGAIIGKAMTGLKSGRGLVLVLVTLQ